MAAQSRRFDCATFGADLEERIRRAACACKRARRAACACRLTRGLSTDRRARPLEIFPTIEPREASCEIDNESPGTYAERRASIRSIRSAARANGYRAVASRKKVSTRTLDPPILLHLFRLLLLILRGCTLIDQGCTLCSRVTRLRRVYKC